MRTMDQLLTEQITAITAALIHYFFRFWFMRVSVALDPSSACDSPLVSIASHRRSWMLDAKTLVLANRAIRNI